MILWLLLRCVALRLALAFAKASDEKQANGERCFLTLLLYVVILSVLSENASF